MNLDVEKMHVNKVSVVWELLGMYTCCLLIAYMNIYDLFRFLSVDRADIIIKLNKYSRVLNPKMEKIYLIT